MVQCITQHTAFCLTSWVFLFFSVTPNVVGATCVEVYEALTFKQHKQQHKQGLNECVHIQIVYQHFSELLEAISIKMIHMSVF